MVPRLPPDVEDGAVPGVTHHDPAGVARHPARSLGRHAEPVGVLERGVSGHPLAGPDLTRLRGNVRPGFVSLGRRPCRSAYRIFSRLGFERLCLDMQHHLIAVARRSPVEVGGQRALGQQAQRVRLPLAEAGLGSFFR